MLSQVVELIENKKFFGITTHRRPDGDGIGSSLALYWLLKSLDKQAEIIVRDPVPSSCQRLPGADEVRRVEEIDRDYDAVFVMECSDVDRPGIKNLEQQCVVNIDHHSSSELFGDINWIDSTASAVGEMIYNLCKAIGGRVTREIAECVYTALLTDTGSFHFSNTTERTFKVASELIRAGVKPAKLAESVFNSYPWSRIELLAKVMSSVRRDPTGKVAALRQTQEMLELAKATEEDAEGFVNIPLSAEDVEAVVMLKESEPGVFRASLRSKGEVNVARIAEKFGGGGHRNAAGCTMRGDWDSVENELMEMLIEAVARANNQLDITEDALALV
ncbi:MAG TPA: bifunctional oligoribonuclease/PAP phosphatase NrnA [Pyrinomonadaceae bacterium]|nr:bifunctional oligoribonuclease/PAP phosphatase NrnA [Pyrinomonadaceae bacterium]